MAMTAKQEEYAVNLEIKKMSQREAYISAYPKAAKWKPSVVDSRACVLAKDENVMKRRMELRSELKEEAKREAKWSKEDFYFNAMWLIEFAKQEAESGKKLSSPTVSALTNMYKELNEVYGVNVPSDENDGSMSDIISAVKGVNADD